MDKTIEVIYEKGVFKPIDKVDFEEGERIRITINKKLKKTAGLVELLEKLSEKFKDVKEDPLEALLQMRGRTWD